MIIAGGVIVFAYLVIQGLDEVAHLERGMIELRLPSGASAYLRRQAYFGKPAEVYLSANSDFCAPYARNHSSGTPLPESSR
jgi:hypothetical protein